MQEQLITSHVKGHHLSDIERGSINELHRRGFSNRQIAVQIGVCPQTINNELHRGEIDQVKRVNGSSTIVNMIRMRLAHVINVVVPDATAPVNSLM